MVLLAIACFLLFSITYFTGIAAQQFIKKFLGIDFIAISFETFLFGLMACFVYFNLLSFFIPVDYRSLLLPLLLAGYAFSKTTVRNDFFSRIAQTARIVFSKKNMLFVLPLLVLFFVYWIIPPENADSGEYHYIAIRWYEQFKIIPGLGNVHGRLAFNPASFIISSAYSFTSITGQALYPLNGVLVLLFYTWFIKKLFAQSNTIYSLVILVLFVLLFRIALINISSPSSDLLSGLILFYCGFRTWELITAHSKTLGDYFPVLAIACFAVTAKLSAIPALLLLPFIYFAVIKNGRSIPVLVKSILLITLLMGPWLIRNFLLSGYLLYPVMQTGFFKADWTVPHNVIKLDFLYSKYGPRTITVDFFTMQKMNTLQLIKVWYQYMLTSSLSSLLITAGAFLSAMAWILFRLLKKKIPVNIFLLWCIYYVCVLVWFINSPEHRFGLSYMLLATGIPLLSLTKTTAINWKIPAFIYPAVMFASCFHYSAAAFKKDAMYSFSLSDCWWKPLRDRRYRFNNDLATFPSVNLGNGVRLFYQDDHHECLNAIGPCMNWRYGTIEMRGNKIEDGFRSTKDEVSTFFPFVDADKQN